MLHRADIFWARPTHLSPTPRKETRKSAVYELARTCTQERPWQSAKIKANAEKQFLPLMKGHAVTLQILFLLGISWWWKVEKPFSSLIFWKHGAVNEFYGRYFLSNKGDRVSRHLRSGKAEIVTLGTLYVNKHATSEFKISSCYSFLTVNCAIMIINNQIVE